MKVIHNPPTRWYYRKDVVIIALLSLGPLALPLLAFSPKFRFIWKIVIAILVMAFTVWLIIASGKIYLDLVKRLDELKAIYGVK